MKYIIYLLLAVLSSGFLVGQTESGTVVVRVTGIPNNQGKVMIGLYNNEKDFPVYDKAAMGASVAASQSGVKHTFRRVPAGTYAIGVFHDENENKNLDKNWLGIPKEAYGFSNNKYGAFGPPDFDDVSFKIDDNTVTFSINMK